MPQLHDDWTVLPHGPLRELEPGLLTVVGQIPMPLGNFPRRMTVVALPKKRTAIFSPVALDPLSMARIEALGEPAYLIIPNGGHRLDARPFKARYPKAKVIAAKGAAARVGEAVTVDASTANLGKAIDLFSVPGMGDSELALVIRGEGGTSLLVNDIIGHVRSPQGIGARIMARMTGFGPRARVPRLLLARYVKDKAALAAQLRKWAALPGLKRIIMSHGDVIDDAPGAQLARIANELS